MDDQLFSLLWKGCLIAGALLIAAASSLGILKWKHDNPIEETAEMIVYRETGLNIDLSPSDPDPDKMIYTDSDEAVRNKIMDEKGWDSVETPR